MKNILYISTVLWMFIGNAQAVLEGVSLNAEITPSNIQLEEGIRVHIPDSVATLRLKGLLFDKTKPAIKSVSINGKTNDFEQKEENGLKLITITSEGIPIKNITIRYVIDRIENELFYIPVFFTNLPAATSDVGFFNMNMALHPEQNYTILFPNVIVEEEITNQESKEVRFDIPALPSMIRMELLSEDKQAITFISSVDWIVALIFVIIGYFIWRNRKHLVYG